MKCRKAQKLVSAMHDGEVDERTLRAVRVHLDACPSCRHLAEQLPWWDQSLDLLVAPEPRSGFTGRFMARLEETRPQRVRSLVWFEIVRPGRVAAAVLALACGAALAFSMNGPSSPPRTQPQAAVDVLYADAFEAAPRDSAGARYLALLQPAER